MAFTAGNPVAWASVLEALMEAAASVLAADSLDDTLRRMADRLAELVPYDDLTVYEADHQAALLVPAFACGSYVAEVMAHSFPLSDGITGATLRDGRMRNIPNTADLPDVAVVAGTEPDPEAFVCVPLMVESRTIGALNVYRIGSDVAFSDHEAHIVERFGVMAALAFDSARQRELLRRQADTDGLTGLLNRRAFQSRLNDAVGSPRGVYLVVADVDNFKDINDTYGHAVGDQALVAVATAIDSALRDGDVVGRLGGEEFGFLLQATDLPTALAVTERVRAAVRELRVVDHDITLSAGMATLGGDVRGADELFGAADAALYRAKRAGRNRTVCHSA